MRWETKYTCRWPILLVISVPKIFVLLKLIVKNVVTCFFWNTVYYYYYYYFYYYYYYYYGRPLSVSGRPCYILPMFFFKFFLWPPYSPALVNGGSRKFYTWWNLSGIEEVTTWIFSWSPLNYRVGQKVTKFRIFLDPPANFLLSRPNAAEYCNSEKNSFSIDDFSTTYATFGELWRTNP